MASGRLLVVCKDDQALDIVDLGSGTITGRVRASGFTPHEVAAAADGARAYLPIYSDAWLGDPGSDGRSIDIVDLVELRVARTIPIEGPSRPHLPAIGADGMLYVSTELDESISIIDPVARAKVARLPTGRPQSHMFVLSPDGARAYSANVDTGSISIIDVARRELVDVVEVAEEINRISVTPDGGTAFCADQRRPRIAALDIESRRVEWIALPSRGFGTAVTPDGRCLVVALRWESQIGVIDLVTRTLVTVIDVPAQPQAIVIHPEEALAYSACDAAGQVVEVDLQRGEVSRTFTTGAGPDGICWAPDPA